MKIKYLVPVIALFCFQSIQAQTNSFTGLSEGTTFQDFCDQMSRDSTKRLRFISGLFGNSTDPADAGTIRLQNAELIAWEASPAGTDVTLTVNSSEQFVFSAAILSPILVTPALGTPASGVLTNATGLPIASGVSGLGTGVATALAVANNTAGGYSPIDGTATLSNKTLATPVISTGLTASGSASNDFSGSTGTFKTSSGLTTIAGGEVRSTSALSGAGVVVLTSCVTKLTTTGASQALSLADGTDGQVKTIVHDVDGGSAILTPTTKTGFTTITFTNVGESATLVFVTTRGWIILSLNGAVAA